MHYLTSIYLSGILSCVFVSCVAAVIEARRIMNTREPIAYSCKKYDGFLTAKYIYRDRKPLVGFLVRLQCYIEYLAFGASTGFILGMCGPPGWWLTYRLIRHILFVKESNYLPLTDREVANLEDMITIEIYVKKD